MELPLHNTQGEVVGQTEVADALFAAPANPALVHQVLVAQQANHRAGTHSTKTRSEVSGGGRKPRPQKHSGRSRQGTIRAPQWRGGGIVHGPRPRSHHQDIPKTMRRMALRSALSSRVAAEEVILVEGLALDAPRTKDLKAVLEALGASRSTLLVIKDSDPNVVRSARNLAGVKALCVDRINVEEVLRRHRIVMTVDAVRRAEELWGRPLTKRETQAQGAAA